MGEITFEDLVQHGRDNGGNIVNGMPWSFKFNVFDISHERDDCYIINGGGVHLHIHPGDIFSVEEGGVRVINNQAWISSAVRLPATGTTVEVSDDGETLREQCEYSASRKCMLAGESVGSGYFGEGFATDGSTGCDYGLILDTPAFWRYPKYTY